MAEEIIISGKTVEEAMAAAAAKYSGENVSYEIAEMPKKGFLGIGSTPAKIKVTIGAPEEDDVDLKGIVSQVKDMKVTTNRGGSGNSEPSEAKSNVAAKSDRHERAPRTEKPKEHRTPRAERRTPNQEITAPAAPAAPAPAAAEKPAAEKPKENAVPVKPRAPRAEVTEEEKAYALEFTRTLLKNMEINATADYASTEKSIDGEVSYPRIEISGEGTGILIGHHGETLDAIQYLVNLTALRRGGNTQKEFVKIVVDIENYRAKREETLRALARRMAAKAVKYKRNVLLEPMNPYERRIIHSEVQGIENVSTHSVGSDENRKIVITYEGPDKAERPYNRRGGYRKGN